MEPAFSLELPLEEWVRRGGTIQRTTRRDGILCLQAEMDGRPVFFKQARNRAAARGLARVVDLYDNLRHPVLPSLYGYWTASDGPLLVFEQLQARPLVLDALAPERALTVLDALFDLHVTLAERGWVSAGFSPSSWLLDGPRTWVVDLDHYRPGPYRAPKQPPGAEAFWAPEERRPGAQIDERTTVFHLGRAAQVLLGEALPPALAPLVERATRVERRQRYQRVWDFVAAWRRELGVTGLPLRIT